jgi:hypothetical protein
MAGEKVFHDVLRYVAKSKLNFSILQTPFSAQLSLNKSFVKNFHDNIVYEFVNRHEVLDNSDVCKETIKELENRMTTVNLENIRLKKIIEEKDDAVLDLEKLNESLQTNLKVEKKKNKKERQKNERNLAEEQKSQEKVEPDENTAIHLDVPTSNKLAVLKTKESDSRNFSKIINKSVSSQTERIQCQICNSFLPPEMSLSDHIGRNHRELHYFFYKTIIEKVDMPFCPYN